MKGFGVLFVVFGICVFLYGVYIALGHNPIVKTGYVIKTLKLTKTELKHLGHLVEIFSIPIFLSGISGLFFEEENIVPALILLIALIMTIVLVVIIEKKKKDKGK